MNGEAGQVLVLWFGDNMLSWQIQIELLFCSKGNFQAVCMVSSCFKLENIYPVNKSVTIALDLLIENFANEHTKKTA